MTTIINHRSPAARWVLLVLCVLFPSAALAQTATFRATLRQGDILRYDLSALLEVSRGDAPADRLEQHARLRLTVAEIDDEGAATLRGTIESLDIKWKPAAGDAAAFEWKEGKQLADDAPPLAKAYGTLATTPIELTVTKDGVIKSADGPDKAATAAEAAGFKPPEQILGALGSYAVTRSLAPIFSLDHKGVERKPGDTWTDESRLPGIGAAAVKVATARTLKSLGSDEARIDATLTQSWIRPPGQPDPTAPTAASPDQKGTAEERWDTKSARLTSRTQDTTITWKFQLQTAPPIEATRKVHARVELKLGPSSPPKP